MPLQQVQIYRKQDSIFFLPKGYGRAMIVDFYRTVIDTEACETFTEVIGATATDPYVMGTRIKISDGKVTEIEALITNKDDWLFNAETYLKYSPKEKWDILAPEMRSDRQNLIRIANAYFNVFKDSSALKEVPWNIPCERLEGGRYTNPENKPDASCTGGPPLEGSIEITNRRLLWMLIWAWL
jgi:hypothetical protein